MSGKTNIFLGLISTILISVGAISVSTAPSNPYFGIIITICGAIGLGVREYLKPKPNASIVPHEG
ncbi:MAG TPA: hypothetical protein VIH04_07910 [Nitrosarchaeum sp.]